MKSILQRIRNQRRQLLYSTQQNTSAFLLTESGGHILLENGGRILLETGSMADQAISGMTPTSVVQTTDVVPGLRSSANVGLTFGTVAAINLDSNTAHFLRGDGTWVTPSSSSLTIGAVVNSGTPTYVLFVDGSGNLGQSVHLTLSSAGTLTAGQDLVATRYVNAGLGLNVINGGAVVQAGTTYLVADLQVGGAIGFGGFVVDTSGNLTKSGFVPTTGSNWNGSPPTTIHAAIDRIAALLKTLNSGTGP